MGKTELKIDADLVAQAEAAGLPVEQVAEEALRAALRKADMAGGDARAAKWAEENAEGIEDYNRRIRERGVFSTGLRKW
jgi:antitoxin CcdA